MPLQFLRGRLRSAGVSIRLLRLLGCAGPVLAPACVAVAIVTALVGIPDALLTGFVVGSVPAAVRGGLGSPQLRHLELALAAFGLFFVAQQLLWSAQGILSTYVVRRVDGAIRDRVASAMLAPSTLAGIEDPTTRDLLTQATNAPDAVSIGTTANNLLSTLLRYARQIAYAVVLMKFSPFLGAGLFVAMLIARSTVRIAMAPLGEGAVKSVTPHRHSMYFQELATSSAGAKEGRIFGLLPWILTRYREQRGQALRFLFDSYSKTALPTVIWAACVSVVYVGVYGWIISVALAGTIGIGAATTYLLMADSMQGGSYIGDLPSLIGAAKVLEAIDELERRAGAGARAGESLADQDAPLGEIAFNRVTFSYPGQSERVLSGLDLSIRAGTSTALVGLNGAGKTTLIKLLAGLHEPLEGTIRVDGQDLARVDPSAWRKRLAIIFQDFTQYALPASDNVGFGALHMGDDREAMQRAAARVGATEVIDALPRGWDTVLNRSYTDGADLSGGQWQRVALARALMAVEGGARVLILDEPTANLDVRAEADLFDRFLEITHGLTTILVSHRFSTVRRADRIVVLEHGAIVEDGSHDALLDAGGRYARLFNLQASRFAQ